MAKKFIFKLTVKEIEYLTWLLSEAIDNDSPDQLDLLKLFRKIGRPIGAYKEG